MNEKMTCLLKGHKWSKITEKQGYLVFHCGRCGKTKPWINLGRIVHTYGNRWVYGNERELK